MYIVKFKQTRPSVDVLFYSQVMPAEVSTYIVTNYGSKFLSHNFETSQDGLTVTITHIWDSEQSFTDYMNDLYIINNLLNPSIEYRNNNNIIQEEISRETI